jgi:2-methylfumaryl-CoA hydratase
MAAIAQTRAAPVVEPAAALASDKTNPGNFFEDFRLGQTLVHATPRTLTEGDAALYTALTGSRFALHCSRDFARSLGYPEAPLDDLLVFHTVFGKSVPDVSLNAVANLGYAVGRFGAPLYAGDTVSATSEVIGLRETSDGKSGVVWVRTRGVNAHRETVLEYVRWVMLRKRTPGRTAIAEPVVPDLPAAVPAERLLIPRDLRLSLYDPALAGSPHLWDDYRIGEKIDHADGMTLEEAEHQMATRLYQNTAKVHFDQLAANENRFGRRIVYGGHVISMARALSFNGLANAFRIVAIHGGRHTAPTFAGDTLFAWTEVLGKEELPGRGDLGVLRLITRAVKNRPASDFPDKFAGKGDDGKPDPSVVLEFDYSVLMPRRQR